MDANQRSFATFWREVKWPFARVTIKSLLGLGILLPLVVIFFRWQQCADWWGYPQPIQEQACADLTHPLEYWFDLLKDLPKLFVALPPLFLGILYLEWDKYKNDKPSGFVYDRFWNEGSRGVTTRKSELMREEMTIGNVVVSAAELKNGVRRFAGEFSEMDFRRFLKSYIGWWNKPVQTSEGHQQWRILIRNGSEVHIDLHRQSMAPATWVMKTRVLRMGGKRAAS